MPRVRMTPGARREQMLKIALRVAERKGYMLVSEGDLAAEAKCARSLIFWHFGSIAGLRSEILQAAARLRCVPVIRQGWAMGAPEIKECPSDVLAEVIRAD